MLAQVLWQINDFDGVERAPLNAKSTSYTEGLTNEGDLGG
jgi:hypothetical protein